MAKFSFFCDKCNKTIEKYISSSSVEDIKCNSCLLPMAKMFPKVGSQKVLEVVDKFTNIKHEVDQRKQLEDRHIEYFWEVEVPRLIQTYSIETCLDNKWLVYNEKGELVIGKPFKKSK